VKIQIINGPNLNLLGTREPGIYGSQSFESFFPTLEKEFPETELFYFQSNIEGELINKIHEVGFSFDGLVLNAGGYTHTSVALHDAVAAVATPVVEVHISNLYAREEFRHRSVITSRCAGLVSGLGLAGYGLAVRWLLERAQQGRVVTKPDAVG
jgi:3-dehydroquinate dehydratase-2